MKNKKKILSIFMAIIMVVSFCVGIQRINADTPNRFSLLVYDQDPDYTKVGDLIDNEGTVDPEQYIEVDVYFVPGTTSSVSMQLGINYPSALLEPVLDGGDPYYEFDNSTTYNGGMWPPKGDKGSNRNSTPWSVASTADTGSSVRAIITDSTVSKPVVNEGTVIRFFFQVKADAAPNSVINLSFDQDYSMMAYDPPVEFSGYKLNVYGESSSNTDLDTLTVKNGSTNYALTPTFTSATTDRTFNTVVPNNISSVDVSATTVDTVGAVVASGTGTQSLSVGNNEINLIVQAEGGATETYTVNVYRLSNDARLGSLSLSGVDIGTFDKDTTGYTALVPFSTSSTTISASTNHSKATIYSGMTPNPWSLDNTGTTKNTRDIVVKAENCDSKYDGVVPGNTCTSKTYSIEITRTPASTNNNLQSLKVNGSSVPSFSPSTTEYTLTDVPNSTNSVTVSAEVQDTGKASIVSGTGPQSLSIGDNTLIVKVKAESGAEKEYKINIRRLNNDANLASLSITSDSATSGSLNPAFSSTFYDYYTYTAPVDATKVTITATLSDTVNGTINTDLSNPFDITSNPMVEILVTAEDGSTNTYKIKLDRLKSSNNYLSSLSVDGYTLTPTFNKTTENYSLTVDAAVSSVNVSATLEDARGTIVSGTGPQSLTYGTNTIEVKTKAENNDPKTYTITVTRSKKNISTLSDLTVDGTTVSGFSPSDIEYTLPKVANSVTSVEIGATATDSDATVTGTGTINLSSGDNAIPVTVTAHDGVTSTTYTINIEREKDSNAYLSEIKVDGNLITGFSKTEEDYNIDVTNDKTSLALTATTESSVASYVISGNSAFETSDAGSYPNLVNITVTAEDGTIKIYKLHVRREKSSNNKLSNITTSSGSLDPAFNPDTTNYTVDVDRSVENITITPTLADSSASYTISGPSSLEIGENTFTVDVMSENGTPKTYTLIVRRNKSSNNKLSEIKIDGVLITGFNPETTDYTVSVSNTTSSIELTATAEDTLATVSGTGTKSISSGDNDFEITVVAENLDEKKYTVKIQKEKSNDAKLKSLAIEQATIDPTFDPDTENYTANVGYEVNNIDVSAAVNDPNSTLTGTGNKVLTTGDNTIEVEVTAEDGTTTKKYTIVVTRTKNNDADLNNLTVENGSTAYTLSPPFNTETTSYNLSVDNSVDNVTITAYPHDTNVSSITGAGNINLSTGQNTIDVTVVAENGTTDKTYTIIIDRAKSSDATLKSLTLASGTLDPAFDPATEDYTVTVNNEIENLGITAVPNSDAALSVIVSGNDNLIVGENPATVVVTAEDGSLKTYNITITRNPSSNNYASMLSVKDTNNVEYIDQGTFDKTEEVFNITVENDMEKVIIAATAEDSSSTVSGAGEKTLDVGPNEFEVVVTSGAGYGRTYKINVFRKGNSNNDLSALSVDQGTLDPAFSAGTTEYTVNVDNTVDSINVSATAAVDTSTVSGTGSHDLVSGANEIKIDVLSQSGETKTYTITVNKAASSNAKLSNLTVSEGTLDPTFDPDTTSYTVSVENAINTITITGTAASSSATVEGDGLKSLSVGENNFTITVKAEDGSELPYNVKVVRAASSINTLSDLTVNGTTISGFSPNETSYTLNVANNVSSVEIGATVTDATATVSGTGTRSLNTGDNAIDVVVTAEDGGINTYTININRAKDSNNYLSDLTIAEADYSPEFNKETITYNLSVPYEVTSLTINAQTEVTTSSVSIEGNNDFVVGENTVNINVTAENNSVKTYTLKVNRLEDAPNKLTSLVVSDTDGNIYPMTPTFSGTTLSYKVGIPRSLSSVVIDAEAEDPNATITGIGTVPITSLPQTQTIVSTANGISRTYKVEFVQGASANNKLLSLSVNPGVLSPAFDKNTNSYNVSLPSGTTSINVSATAADSEAVLIGNHDHPLEEGNNKIDVIVTAPNGGVNTYTINVYVGNPATNNKLTSLTVSEGTLSPEFDKDTKLYNVNVDNSVSSIDINATGPNTITGLGTKSLNEGPNVFEVNSITSDGDKNTYRVVVRRQLSDPSAIIGPELIYLALDGYEIDQAFDPDIMTYTATLPGVTMVDVVAVPKDPNANVVVSGNENITDGGNITVTVTNDTGSKTYTIATSAFLNKLQSDIYVLDDTYVNKIPYKKTAGDIKNEFVNPNQYLKIYDADGYEVNDTDKVGTTYVIKLEKDGTVYDQKVLIVLGDLNSDAYVDVADIISIKSYILGSATLSTPEEKAADVNEDDFIDIADVISIKYIILEGGE